MNHSDEIACPERLETEAALDAFLTRPGQDLIEAIRAVRSPLVLLGAGGKMGPSLAVLARRAADAAGHPLRIIAVSRFGNAQARQWLESRGVETLSCDLLDPFQVARLPESDNVVYLVGLKFGTQKSPGLTWTMNTVVPALVAQRYRAARIVALSTGNVYPMTPVDAGGAVEFEPLTPLGEYPNAAVGRERVFQYYSEAQGTPLVLLRLFYAIDLRYGVLADLAQRLCAGRPIPLATGHFNCIWQGDANAMILRALALTSSPSTSWNLCRPETFSVREVATRLAALMGRAVQFDRVEASHCLLGNARPLCERLGTPAVTMETLLRWTAAWAESPGTYLGRPTHFEVRDGRY